MILTGCLLYKCGYTLQSKTLSSTKSFMKADALGSKADNTCLPDSTQQF